MSSQNTTSTHKIQTRDQAVAYLEEQCDALPQKYQTLLKPIFEEPKFFRWPASLGGHQPYEGGLVVHTAQVLQTALAILSTLKNPNTNAVVVAVFWHDFAKILDYYEVVEIDEEHNTKSAWLGAPHRYHTRHLVKSYAQFLQHAEQSGLSVEEQDFIGHIMLAHHGRLEWGSPTLPQTAEAWAVHAADNLSGRYTNEKD